MDFEATFERHHPALFRYLHRLVGDPDVAEDIAQEAFLRLLDHPLPEDEARPWLFTVATNLVRDRARMRKRRRRLLEEEKGTVEPSAPDPPDTRVERVERIQTVRRALERVGERDRELLLMRQEGFRYKEIAEAVGVAPTSVGTLLARALRRFEAAFREVSGEATEVGGGRSDG